MHSLTGQAPRQISLAPCGWTWPSNRSSPPGQRVSRTCIGTTGSPGAGSIRSQAKGRSALRQRRRRVADRRRRPRRGLRRQVRPDDGMVEHGRDAGLRRRHAQRPGAGVLARHRRRKAPRQVDRAAKARQPFGLVGPDVGQQAERAVRVGEVDGRLVAAGPLGHLGRHIERRRRAVPHAVQPHRRAIVAPGAEWAEVVAIAVPVEVQPGAGADLQAAQRQAGLARHGEEAANEAQRAPHLVGLGRRR